MFQGLFVGVLLRLLPLHPRRFTNSSSAATVGEQRPKPCMQSILDDLVFSLRRHEIFGFYYVPEHNRDSQKHKPEREVNASTARSYDSGEHGDGMGESKR